MPQRVSLETLRFADLKLDALWGKEHSMLPESPADRHRAVAAAFGERVRGVRDWDAEAPVAGWVARDVVRHLLDDPASSARKLSNPRIGDVPLPTAIDRFYTADVFLHTWDLANATGQDDHLAAKMQRSVVVGVEGKSRVRERTSGAHLGRHPDRLHDLLLAGTGSARQLRVAADAVGALGHVGDRDGDELLGRGVHRAIGEGGLAEGVEGRMRLGRERSPLVRHLGRGLGVDLVGHDAPYDVVTGANDRWCRGAGYFRQDSPLRGEQLGVAVFDFVGGERFDNLPAQLEVSSMQG